MTREPHDIAGVRVRLVRQLEKTIHALTPCVIASDALAAKFDEVALTRSEVKDEQQD